MSNPRNAGRKPSDPRFKKNPVSLKLEQYWLDFLRSQPNTINTLVTQALIDKYGNQKPIA